MTRSVANQRRPESIPLEAEAEADTKAEMADRTRSIAAAAFISVIVGVPVTFAAVYSLTTAYTAFIVTALGTLLPTAGAATLLLHDKRRNDIEDERRAAPSNDSAHLSSVPKRKTTTRITHTISKGDVTLFVDAPVTTPTDEMLPQLAAVVEELPTRGSEMPLEDDEVLHAETYSSPKRPDIHLGVSSPRSISEPIIEETIRVCDDTLATYGRNGA